MAVEFRVQGIGIGDETTGINKIVPAMTAGANRIARGGNNTGVLNVLPYNFKLTGTNITSITIGEGMATAYGYDLRNEGAQALNGNPAVASFKYYFVIAEWDLSEFPQKFAIKLFDNGTGATYTPTPQDDLVANPNGRYNMILYRLKVDTSGKIVETKNWEEFGTTTIGYTSQASYADNYSNKGTLQEKFNKIDEKDRQQNIRLDNLGFRKGNVIQADNFVLNSVTLKKQAKYAILTGEIPTGTSTGWLNFRMDFISNETFDFQLWDKQLNGPYTLRLIKGKNTIQLLSRFTKQSVPIRIGFEIQ